MEYTSKSSGRGGKRPGAGRPATGRSTKVVRVPDNFPSVQELEDLLTLLDGWKTLSDEASPTSPRWQKARELLKDVQNCLKKA